MTIILGITLSGGPSAVMRLKLSDNAFQGELMVREAQLQGSAINSMTDRFGGVGVYIDLATSTTMVKFRDKVDTSLQRAIGIGNGLFEQGVAAGEEETVFKLANNNRITMLCVSTGTQPILCNDELTPDAIRTLTISFTRPKQTAHIYVNDVSATEYSSACIQFDSPKSPAAGFVRSVLVYRSGMITKNLGTCK
jgi:hypothetical protein